MSSSSDSTRRTNEQSLLDLENRIVQLDVRIHGYTTHYSMVSVWNPNSEYASPATAIQSLIDVLKEANQLVNIFKYTPGKENERDIARIMGIRVTKILNAFWRCVLTGLIRMRAPVNEIQSVLRLVRAAIGSEDLDAIIDALRMLLRAPARDGDVEFNTMRAELRRSAETFYTNPNSKEHGNKTSKWRAFNENPDAPLPTFFEVPRFARVISNTALGMSSSSTTAAARSSGSASSSSTAATISSTAPHARLAILDEHIAEIVDIASTYVSRYNAVISDTWRFPIDNIYAHLRMDDFRYAIRDLGALRPLLVDASDRDAATRMGAQLDNIFDMFWKTMLVVMLRAGASVNKIELLLNKLVEIYKTGILRPDALIEALSILRISYSGRDVSAFNEVVNNFRSSVESIHTSPGATLERSTLWTRFQQSSVGVPSFPAMLAIPNYQRVAAGPNAARSQHAESSRASAAPPLFGGSSSSGSAAAAPPLFGGSSSSSSSGSAAAAPPLFGGSSSSSSSSGSAAAAPPLFGGSSSSSSSSGSSSSSSGSTAAASSSSPILRDELIEIDREILDLRTNYIVHVVNGPNVEQIIARSTDAFTRIRKIARMLKSVNQSALNDRELRDVYSRMSAQFGEIVNAFWRIALNRVLTKSPCAQESWYQSFFRAFRTTAEFLESDSEVEMYMWVRHAIEEGRVPPGNTALFSGIRRHLEDVLRNDTRNVRNITRDGISKQGITPSGVQRFNDFQSGLRIALSPIPISIPEYASQFNAHVNPRRSRTILLPRRYRQQNESAAAAAAPIDMQRATDAFNRASKRMTEQMKRFDIKDEEAEKRMLDDDLAKRLRQEDELCPICDNVELNDSNCTQLPCRHRFCGTCIYTWFQQSTAKKTCPICRREIDVNKLAIDEAIRRSKIENGSAAASSSSSSSTTTESRAGRLMSMNVDDMDDHELNEFAEIIINAPSRLSPSVAAAPSSPAYVPSSPAYVPSSPAYTTTTPETVYVISDSSDDED